VTAKRIRNDPIHDHHHQPQPTDHVVDEVVEAQSITIVTRREVVEDHEAVLDREALIDLEAHDHALDQNLNHTLDHRAGRILLVLDLIPDPDPIRDLGRALHRDPVAVDRGAVVVNAEETENDLVQEIEAEVPEYADLEILDEEEIPFIHEPLDLAADPEAHAEVPNHDHGPGIDHTLHLLDGVKYRDLNLRRECIQRDQALHSMSIKEAVIGTVCGPRVLGEVIWTKERRFEASNEQKIRR